MAITTQRGTNGEAGACRACRRLPGRILLTDVVSPFEKRVILNHYDGILTAALQCGACGSAYYGKIIDWDATFDRRIFSLATLPPGAFDQIIALNSRGGETPIWPTWSPHRSPDEPEHSEIDAALERLLAKAEPPYLLITTDRYIKRVRAARVSDAAMYIEIRKSNSEGFPSAARDWFEYVGIPR